MVDAVREAPRILLQVKERERSAEKRVARGCGEGHEDLTLSTLFFLFRSFFVERRKVREARALSHFLRLDPPPPTAGKKTLAKKGSHVVSSPHLPSPRRRGRQ